MNVAFRQHKEHRLILAYKTVPNFDDSSFFHVCQKLDFTLSDCSSPPDMAFTRTLSPEELNKQLEKLLLEDVASDEQIFDWVEVQGR